MINKLIAFHICLLTVYTAQGMSFSITDDSNQTKTINTQDALQRVRLLLEEYKIWHPRTLSANDPAEAKASLARALRVVSQIEAIICSFDQKAETLHTYAENGVFLEEYIKLYTLIEQLEFLAKDANGKLAFLYFDKYETCTDLAEKKACLEQALVRGTRAANAPQEPGMATAKKKVIIVSRRLQEEFSKMTSDKENDKNLAELYFLMARIFYEKSNLEQDAEQKQLFKQQFSQWNLKAAEKGHANAQCIEGAQYRNKCLDASPNERSEYEKKAIEWLEKAAAQDLASAEYELGRVFYKQSETVTNDGNTNLVLKAIVNFFEASHQGHAEAKERLKHVLSKYDIEGVVMPGALLGDPQDQFFTGVVYLNKAEQATSPEERESCFEKAIEWLEKSACQNYFPKNTLGEILYEKAKTESQPAIKHLVNQAAKWFFFAEKEGHPLARKNLESTIREHHLELKVDGNILIIKHNLGEYTIPLNSQLPHMPDVFQRIKAAAKELASSKTAAPVDATVEKICAKCSKQAGNVCSRCKKVRYCSVNCQKEDWAKHKQECKSPDQPHV